MLPTAVACLCGCPRMCRPFLNLPPPLQRVILRRLYGSRERSDTWWPKCMMLRQAPDNQQRTPSTHGYSRHVELPRVLLPCTHLLETGCTFSLRVFLAHSCLTLFLPPCVERKSHSNCRAAWLCFVPKNPLTLDVVVIKNLVI